jgi:hypothetical protein
MVMLSRPFNKLPCVNSYKAILGSSLEQGNYFKRFSLLLHCEELQMELDIRNYDMEVSSFDQYKVYSIVSSSKTILGGTKSKIQW